MLEASDTSIHPFIFRAYDIRGIVNKTLREVDVYHLGKAIGTKAIRKGERSIALGRDGRLSSPILHGVLSEGLLSTGLDVIDLGVIPTPLLYYATYVLETRSGVMLTGSHNPAEYNGLKMMINRETLAEKGIQDLYHAIIAKDFHRGEGQLSELDIIERYMTHIVRDVRLQRPLKIVMDCGNGVASAVAPELYRRLGAEVIELFCDIDGNFPNHHPDPSVAENLAILIEKVQETGADIGIAFDGDGDRLGVVTNKGELIWPDRQLMLFAKAILKKHSNAKIIYDVKCTRHLADMIRQWGGEPIMWKTGHSLIKSKLIETQAMLAGEMSGHIFIKDKWYGFDDAIYAGARLLEILSKENETSSALFAEIPNSVNTPELKIYVDETEKFTLMSALIQKANFATAENITIDGLRVNFADGWGLIRPSNTTPCLVLRFEAESEIVLKRIQDLFRDLLFSVKPDLEIPF
ncbi:MAG TPA: phosphomannomutase/phosphoglucomutase [Gammaproteobacteria bacterium]|nr:phosphomannomutase/phosphoglucomutase [Gammaproteobacteria bacterium]